MLNAGKMEDCSMKHSEIACFPPLHLHTVARDPKAKVEHPSQGEHTQE